MGWKRINRYYLVPCKLLFTLPASSRTICQISLLEFSFFPLIVRRPEKSPLLVLPPSLTEMCQVLIVLSLRQLQVPGAGGKRPPSNTPVNAVWFYCHFLWWKVINSPSPPLPSLPPICHPFSILGHWSMRQTLVYPLERHGGPFPVLHLSSEPFHKPLSPAAPRSSSLLFLPLLLFNLFTEALPRSCRFFYRFLSVKVKRFLGSFSSAILTTAFRGNTLTRCTHTYCTYILYVWQLVNISTALKISWNSFHKRDSIF